MECFRISLQVYRIQGRHDGTAARTVMGASIAMRVPEAFAVELLGTNSSEERKLLDGVPVVGGDLDTRGVPTGWQNAKEFGSVGPRVGAVPHPNLHYEGGFLIWER
jgi:hypothetical protein